MIVDGSDIDPVLDQLGHDRIDFALEQHEVAHHHRAAMRGLERGPAAERKCRFDGDAIKRHLQIGARKSVAMNVAGNGGASFQQLHRPSSSRCPGHPAAVAIVAIAQIANEREQHA